MTIKLNEKYILSTDTYCYVLSEKKIKKDSDEEYLIPVGYYGNLEQLINSLINKEICESEVNSIKDVLKTITDVRNDIVSRLKEIDL